MIDKKLQIEWPPIVKTGKLPALMYTRDLAMTLFAWALLFYFMRDLWFLIFEYVEDLFLDIDPSNLFQWKSIWIRIAPFLYIAAILVIWILILSALRRRAIHNAGKIHGKKSTRTVHQHFTLRPIEKSVLAKRFGIEQSQLETWHSLHSFDVMIDDKTQTKLAQERNR
jgi:hypothetical protein